MRTAIFFLIVASGCLNKTEVRQVKPIANTSTVSYRIQDTILLYSRSKEPLNLYYLSGLKGHPVILPAHGSAKIVSSLPIYLMETSDLQVGYLLNPGDSVTVKSINHQILFESSDKEKNNELNFFSEVSKRFGSLRHLFTATYLKGKMGLNKRDQLISDQYQNRVLFLETYRRQHQISKTFTKIALAVFQYALLNEKLSLFYPAFNKTDIHKFYQDSLLSFKELLNCDTCLNLPMYQAAAHHLVRIQIKESSATTPLFMFDGLGGQELLSLRQKINELNDKTKDFLTARLFQQLLFESNATKTTINLDSLLTNVYAEEYKTSLKKIYHQLFKSSSTSSFINQLLFTTNGQSTSFESLIKTNSGKIILLDFWATWCVPCIQETPFSKQLQQEFGNKDFAVVYISIDEDEDAWRAYSQQNLESKNSYWLEKGSNSNLAKEISLLSIPRYILLDRKGNITNSDAPRPSDRKLRDLIKKLF